MKTKIFIATIAIFLTSCKDESISYISFSEPQPQNKINLKEIPSKLFGVFKNYDTENQLIINKNSIVKIQLEKIILSKEAKDSILLDKELNSWFVNKKFKEYKNDSILMTYEKMDTLFFINKDVIRKYKGHYFINTKIDSAVWGVKKISFKQNVLNLNSISTNNEIKIMEEIMESKPQDSINLPINVNPTRKQFKEFIKKTGFTNGESYIKVK